MLIFHRFARHLDCINVHLVGGRTELWTRGHHVEAC